MDLISSRLTPKTEAVGEEERRIRRQPRFAPTVVAVNSPSAVADPVSGVDVLGVLGRHSASPGGKRPLRSNREEAEAVALARRHPRSPLQIVRRPEPTLSTSPRNDERRRKGDAPLPVADFHRRITPLRVLGSENRANK